MSLYLFLTNRSENLYSFIELFIKNQNGLPCNYFFLGFPIENSQNDMRGIRINSQLLKKRGLSVVLKRMENSLKYVC